MKHELTARRLNEALQNAGITAQELSRRSGVNKASISQYRNGTHAPSNISAGKMAKVLNVSPLWLMGFDTPEKQDMVIKGLHSMYIMESDNVRKSLEKYDTYSLERINAEILRILMERNEGDRK